jgi:hypothetical protein
MDLRYFLYDKTKGAQYAQIIEEDDEAQVPTTMVARLTILLVFP